MATARGDRYARAALAEELARVATAPIGHRNRQLWESTRNLYNLVATGALDHREVDHALLAAADRCGLLEEEPRQTRTNPHLATPACSGGRRANRGGEVMAMPAAGQEAGQT